MKKLKIGALPLVMIFVMACSLGAPVERVITATPEPATQTPFVVVITATSEPATSTPISQPPTNAPEPPPPVVIPQAGPPTVSVSVDTQCRYGPGQEYLQVGGLVVGKTAKVVGKSADGQYWIIKNTTDYGNCWLWAKYATVTGDVSQLSVIEEPVFMKEVNPNLNVQIGPDPLVPGQCFYQAHATGFPKHFHVDFKVTQKVDGVWKEMVVSENVDTENGNFWYRPWGFESRKFKGDLVNTQVLINLNGSLYTFIASADEADCK